MCAGFHNQSPRLTMAKADTELRQMVEDFYNRDFGESIAEPSQEERRFMKRAEESLTLKDGHYEIAPPFKDLKCSIPNNRIQAEQRASWLKKKL